MTHTTPTTHTLWADVVIAAHTNTDDDADMSFVEKCNALRAFFCIQPEKSPPAAIKEMNEMMGIEPDGALPVQIEKLLMLTGVMVENPTIAPTARVPPVQTTATTEEAAALAEPALLPQPPPPVS